MKAIPWCLCAWPLWLFVLASPAWAGAPTPAPEAGVEHTGEHELITLGQFTLESGSVIDDVRVSYVTHGTLNDARDNVILALHGIAQDHHALDFLIGPGKALDPERYFIVATDFLGNATLRDDLTTGPTNSGLRMQFPRFNIADSMNLDYRFMTEYLGIDHIRMVIGDSTGAIKALQLGARYPDFMDAIVPLAGAPVFTGWGKATMRNVMDIMRVSSGWQGGNYDENPRAVVMTAAMTFTLGLLSLEWFDSNLTTEQAYHDWHKQWRRIWTFFLPLDARDLYYLFAAHQNFDLRPELGNIKARTLFINTENDMFYPHAAAAEAAEVMADARLLTLNTPLGHIGVCCGWDEAVVEAIDAEVAALLADLP